MGGNALKQTYTRRLHKSEFFELYDEVKEVLTSRFNIPENDIHLIRAYKNKETFGDMDILIVSESVPNEFFKQLIKNLSLSDDEWSVNSNVLSFAYNECQVDVILTPRNNYVASQNYFAYNDLGNLMGRLFKRLGIKYGHQGLQLVVRQDDRIVATIPITTDMKDICELIGVSYETFEAGFDELEDVFQFIITSPYFHPDIYLLENVNHVARIRDRKRATYTAFLAFCKSLDVDKYNKTKFNTKHTDHSLKYGHSIKEPFFSEILLPKYPHLQSELDKIAEEQLHKKQFAAVFNGNLLIEWLGITGKLLGDFISYAKSQVTEDIAERWILSPSIVKTEVLEMYNQYRKQK